ncbi:MAG: hypothetical protein K0Q66_2257, partial [Chitinophagaceae bacterium]|nr:hypothetical protein [Chitinophagaceae bacterium]
MSSPLASKALQPNMGSQQGKTFLFFVPYFLFLILASACSPSKFISKQATRVL